MSRACWTRIGNLLRLSGCKTPWRAAYNSAMVAVLHAAPQTAAPQAVAAWLDTLSREYSAAERASFAAAFEYARSALRRRGDARRRTGARPRAGHGDDPGRPQARSGFDPGGVAAGAARRRRRSTRTRSPPNSAAMSRRSSPASRAWASSAPMPTTGNAEERAAQAENLRKMLLSMVEDIRVVLIKLAERTQALRYAHDRRRGAADAGCARGARPVRAARQPARRLAVEVGARGPEPARARARRVQVDRRRCSTSAGSIASATSRT